MKITVAVALLAFSSLALAQNTLKDFSALSNTLGAVSTVLAEKTEVAGVAENKPVVTPNADAVHSDLNHELDNCKTTEINKPEIIEYEKDGTTISFKKYNIVIDGPNCGLKLESGMDIIQKDDINITGVVYTRLTFKDPALIAKFKVTNLEVTGTIVGRIEQIDTLVKTLVDFEIAASGNGTDVGPFSQSVRFTTTSNIDMATFNFETAIEINAKVKYKNVNDDLYSKIKVSGFTGFEQLFTLNGAAITASEFQQYSQSFVMPGMVDAADENPEPQEMLSCQYVVYDKAKMKANDLKALLNAGTAANGNGFVSSLNTCRDRNAQNQFSFDGQAYNNQIKFEKDWITSISSFTTDAEPTNIYLLYNDAEAQATESDQFTAGFQCKPVPSCN